MKMHWKEEGRNWSEEGRTDGSITCPVCSNVLRRDVMLQDHLNTHPKQEVIEALIHLNDSIKESSNVRRSSIITPVPVASVFNNPETSRAATITVAIDGEVSETRPDLQVAPAAPAPPSTPQIIASSLPSSSGNHFISFPPFLSPSALPQFISLPLLAGSNPSTNQASLMPLLFNPFMFPSASPLSAEQMESTPHLQYLSPGNILRPPFQIVQAGTNSSSSNVHSTFSTACAQQTPQVLPSYSRPDTAEESNLSSCDSEDSTPEITDDSKLDEEVDKLERPSTPLKNSDDKADALSDNVSNNGSPGRPLQDWSDIGSPGNHSVCSVEGSLRVRTDLGLLSAASPPSTKFDGDTKASEPDVNQEQPSCPEEKRAISATLKNEPTSSSSEVTHRPVIVHVGSSKTCAPCAEVQRPNAESSSTKTSKVVETSGQALKNSLFASDSATTSTGVEGLHFLVPSHFLENSLLSGAKCDQSTEPLSPGRPVSPPCDSSPTSPYQKSVDSPIVPLNIQTDETMPPRGELSEQESIGGNSSSMWSVPPYQMTRELLSPVVSTSFDLTARESWAGSDISVSDCEGNANQAPDSSVYKFTTTPSFSNTLPALLPKTSEGFSPDHKSLLLQNQLQGPGKGKGSNKPPPKPRVYKCKACLLEFACPKERRVHPCEKIKKEPKTKTSSTERTQVVVQTMSMSECNVVAGSSTTDHKECLPLKLKRKYVPKPKAGDVEKENVDIKPTSQPHISEVRHAEQSDCSERCPNSGESQASEVWPAGQFGDIRPLGQSPYAQVFHDAQHVDKVEKVDVSELKMSYQALHTNSEVRTQSGEVTYMEVTPALLDQSLKDEYFKVKRCTECNLIFSNGKDLSRHMTLKHNVKRYQCTTCGESFDKESTYYEHLNVHPLECRLCGKCFLRRKSLNLHMKWHMDVKPYKCDSCEKSFVTRQKLDEHQNTHTGNAPIKCPFCDETFKRYSNLIQHKNRHHLNIKRKVKDYICHCGEVFQSKKKLEWHKEIHDNKPKSCPYCCEKFVHTSSLTRHVRKAHDRRYVPKAEREGENVECPICHRVFLKSSLATHLRVHSGERPFSCHICGKDFTTKWNLQHHKWTHASRSSKPFKCTLCKAAFYRKQDYNGHIRSHRNVRPYTCNHCGCQFIRKYNCLRHMKEHESDKKYTCTICNKTFHRGYYLKDHMRVHDGSRPFSCHICGKASTTKSNHNKHVRIHHAREPQNTEI